MLLKTISMGRNTKIPFASPDALFKSNAMFVIQWGIRENKENPRAHLKDPKFGIYDCALPDPKHFTIISGIFWRQLITIGKCLQQEKEIVCILYLLLKGPSRQSFTSAHSNTNIQFPLLSISGVHVTYKHSFIYFQN